MYIFALTCIIAFAATLANAEEDKTHISICSYNLSPGDSELLWNLEYEGYKSLG